VSLPRSHNPLLGVIACFVQLPRLSLAPRSARFSRDRNDPKPDAAGGMVLEVPISPGGAFMDGVAVVTTPARGVLVAGSRSLRVGHRSGRFSIAGVASSAHPDHTCPVGRSRQE
jgi:hypothetical protein